MSAPASSKAPLRRRDPRRFYTVLVVMLVVLVVGGGLVWRRAGWMGASQPQRMAQVPNPPTSGGYLTPVPGLRLPALAPAELQAAVGDSDEDRRIQRQRCVATLDMRNVARYEARQACRQLLNAGPAQP